jgi:hypothetical protein
MKSKLAFQPVFIVMLVIILFVSLTGCNTATAPAATSTATPAATIAATQTLPAAALSVLDLPDGSQFVLNSFTEMKVMLMTGPLSGALGDEAQIMDGETLVVSSLSAGKWFIVLNPNGAIAHVTADSQKPGAIMLVTYDVTSGKFTVDCIRGICELGPDAQHLSNIPVTSQGSLDQGGTFQGPSVFDPTQINGTYGKYIQAGLAFPTAIIANSTPTPDVAGTATVTCKNFKNKFPATPCP